MSPRMATRHAESVRHVGDIHRLARLYGVQVRYRDGLGVVRESPPETLLAILAQLGAGVSTESEREIRSAVSGRRREIWEELIEPVAVAWRERHRQPQIPLRVPASAEGSTLSVEVEFEDGRQPRRFQRRVGELKTLGEAAVGRRRFLTKSLALPAALPEGYHTLRLTLGRRTAEALVISAPRTAYSPEPSTERRWGLFLPLYALRTERRSASGDFTDLESFLEWTINLGGSAVGTLPLSACYLDEPFHPSPYTPVSRRFWNEFYLDPARAPELDRSPRARSLLGSTAYVKECARLGQADLVDYRREMALKRRVLEALARSLTARPSTRRDEFQAYVESRPDLDAYAKFRAVVEARGRLWPDWPARLRTGTIRAGDFYEAARTYHLYVQWLADQQLTALADRAGDKGGGLYLDLPLGVHAGGFDVWEDPELFALNVAGGAPPDRFFTEGQNWGFAPQHPENIRRRQYRPWIACLRSHMRRASMLRIDHVMGLHRLYWVPRGQQADQGAYVRYRARELYAILALESRRQKTVIVGEDLGTVPRYVRARMKARGVRRMSVGQFEFRDRPRSPLKPIAAGTVASLNTHDMRPFAAFWKQLDINDQVDLGLLAADDSTQDRNRREAVKQALRLFFLPDRATRLSTDRRSRLRANPSSKNGTEEIRQMVEALLGKQAASRAEFVMINLEDLWAETEPQNTPGTFDERPNWRRRARYGLKAIKHMRSVTGLLSEINRLRKGRS